MLGRQLAAHIEVGPLEGIGVVLEGSLVEDSLAGEALGYMEAAANLRK